MITENDIKEVESIKQMLRKKLNLKFNWEIVNKIECLDRLVNNLRIAPVSFRFCPPESNFYTVECNKCGWWGSSELLDGGGQIADTGDYGDCYCPVCGNADIDEKDDESTLPSKDEVVGKGFNNANGSEYNRRNVLRDADDDLYYTGWMDCFDWLVGNDR